MRKRILMSRAVTVSLLLVSALIAQTPSKKRVTSQSDLPRFTYGLSVTASEFVQADDATFNAFSGRVRADLDGVFRDYEIADKGTMRNLLGTKLDLQVLAGDYSAALETLKALRAFEDKPAARLTSGVFTESQLQAAIETKRTSGPAFDEAFKKSYSEAVNKLPWDVVQDSIKAAW